MPAHRDHKSLPLSLASLTNLRDLAILAQRAIPRAIA